MDDLLQGDMVVGNGADGQNRHIPSNFGFGFGWLLHESILSTGNVLSPIEV
jgi:hypothetical protein